MSIEIMTEVWKLSKQTGNALLLLLAIGDFADDAGFAWPSVVTLAERTRMDERSVMRLIKSLRATCELYIFRRGNLGNRYVVLSGCSFSEVKRRLKSAQHKITMGDKLSPRQNVRMTPESSMGDSVSGSRVTPESGTRMTPESPDPSVDPSIELPTDLPTAPQPEKPDQALHKHPAVQAYREAARRYPPKIWYQDIADAIGEDAGSVVRWQAHVKDWIGRGWNPGNVKGMLDTFLIGQTSRDGQPRKPSNGSDSHGAAPPAPELDTRARDAVAEIMRQRRGET